MTGSKLDSQIEALGSVPDATPEILAAAERYIRRNAHDQADADLLCDALIGPLTTRKGGRDGSKLRSRSAA